MHCKQNSRVCFALKDQLFDVGECQKKVPALLDEMGGISMPINTRVILCASIIRAFFSLHTTKTAN